MKESNHWQALIGVFRMVLSLAGFGAFMMLTGTFIASAQRGEPIYTVLAVATGFLAISALWITATTAKQITLTSGHETVGRKAF